MYSVVLSGVLAVFFAIAPLQAAEAPPGVNALLGEMDDAEQAYYEHLFDYVMVALPVGENYPWESYNTYGSFKVDRLFQGNGTQCRAYYETMGRKGQKASEARGVGCKRLGSEGWCRLGPNEMHSCALEPPRTIIDGLIQDGTDFYSSSKRKGKQVEEDWWPF